MVGVNGNIPDICNSLFLYHSHWCTKQDNDKDRLWEAAPTGRKLHFSKRAVVLLSIHWIEQTHTEHVKYRNVNLIV